MTILSVLTTPRATTTMIPDLPSPRPRTIMIMKTTMLDINLNRSVKNILVELTMRPCATEMTTSSRKRSTRTTTTTMYEPTTTTSRCQTLSYRSSTIHIAWCITNAIILPGKTTTEDTLSQSLLSIESTFGITISLRITTTSFEIPTTTGIILLSIGYRTTLIPTTYTTSPIRTTRSTTSTTYRAL